MKPSRTELVEQVQTLVHGIRCQVLHHALEARRHRHCARLGGSWAPVAANNATLNTAHARSLLQCLRDALPPHAYHAAFRTLRATYRERCRTEAEARRQIEQQKLGRRMLALCKAA